MGDLAYQWRSAANLESAMEIVPQYTDILRRMLEEGFSDPLDIDAELPDEFMPPQYLQLHGRAVEHQYPRRTYTVAYKLAVIAEVEWRQDTTRIVRSKAIKLTAREQGLSPETIINWINHRKQPEPVLHPD